jgi:putative flippase GtrA
MNSSCRDGCPREPALRVCDFFKTAKNQRCKQYSYGDKMVEKSKMSQTLSEVEGSVPSQARPSLCRWLKFNAVGGVGIVVQLGALAAFRSWLKLDYLLATGLAVEIAVVHNFLWHERYTWADRPATGAMQSLVRLAKFNASNGAVSMVGNLGLMRLLVGEMKFNYVAANLIAVVVCSLVNFLLSDRFVFDAEANSAAPST